MNSIPPLKPIDYHADLQDERLAALAQFFASTRIEAVASHAPLSGDDGWSLGCRAFARCRNLLIQKCARREWDWLGIVNPGKKFIFSIGHVPVRFYRGSYQKAPARTLTESPEELRQLSLAFHSSKPDYVDLKWRFAIETDAYGEPISVIFAGLSKSDGAAVCHWSIAFDPHNQPIDLGSVRSDDMVELPPPSVGSPEQVVAGKHGA